jgi:hypothetical protein
VEAVGEAGTDVDVPCADEPLVGDASTGWTVAVSSSRGAQAASMEFAQRAADNRGNHLERFTARQAIFLIIFDKLIYQVFLKEVHESSRDHYLQVELAQ